MSKSRQLTPTHNLPGASTSAQTESGDIPAAHPSPHDSNKARDTTTEEETRPPESAMRSIVHDPIPHSPISRGVVRPSGHELQVPPAKRIRTKSVGSPEQPGALASPSSDSQGGMADSEGDGKQAGEEASSGPPPKKKRTRTLTTPHQAAVLHALLAQSRFPTTAMREEVGRSIGLSARKVQIWFQNQRQKARRPRNQGSAPTTSDPPQYATYGSSRNPQGASTASYSLGGMNPYSLPGPSQVAEHTEPHPDRFRHHSVPLTNPVTDVPPRLLGPGVPGSESHGHRTSGSRGQMEWPTSAPPTEANFSLEGRFQYSPSQPSTAPSAYLAMGRPLTSQPRSWTERDMSRTLPPLVRNRPSTSSSSMGMRRPFPFDPAPGSYAGGIEPLMSRRSHSPEARFAHQPPDITPAGRSNVVLPPPFTLQPAPRWEEPSYRALSRPTTSSWSRPPSRSISDIRPPLSPSSSRPPEIHRPIIESSSSLRHGLDRDSTPQPNPSPVGRRVSSPPPRPGRYDPVREIFVPFSRPLSPTTTHQSSSQAQHEEKILEPSEEKH